MVVVHHIAAMAGRCGCWPGSGVAYAARRRARAPLAPLPVQYADYAIWQRESLGDARIEGSVWLRQAGTGGSAGGAPGGPDLPSDRRGLPVVSYRRGPGALRVPRRCAGAGGVAAGAGRDGVHGGAGGDRAVLLARLGAGDDIPLGTPVAGRRMRRWMAWSGSSSTPWCCAPTCQEPDVRGAGSRVRQASLGAFAHQDLPFEVLVGDLAPGRSPARHPLFQVMVAGRNGRPPAAGAPGRTSASCRRLRAPKFDLEFNWRKRGRSGSGGLAGAWRRRRICLARGRRRLGGRAAVGAGARWRPIRGLRVIRWRCCRRRAG